MPRRALFAWEIGGGRGHIVKLARVARAVKGRGFDIRAHLVRLEHAREIAPYCTSVTACTRLPERLPGRDHRSSTSYGDWLRRFHFDDHDVISAAIERWRKVIKTERADIVVVDQSPSAVLAARSLQVPVVRIGVPVTTPPAGMPRFPAYVPGADRENYSEDELRRAVNRAIDPYGLPSLSALPEISVCDDDIAATIPPLDGYGEWRDRQIVPPIHGDWTEPGERRREEVFVYLSTFDRFEPAILAAIGTLKLPTRVVLAGHPELSAAAAGWRNATVESQPLPPAEIARRTRVIVHAGNHGTTCLGLRAGIAHVTISQSVEHVFDGRQIEKLGTGFCLQSSRWTVPNIQTAIYEAWESSAMTERAIELARELAPAFAGDPGEMIADRIEALLD
jgi:hypothetical protein